MADATTPNYGLVKPEVGASNDTWGTKQNSNLEIMDALFAALMPKSGGTFSGPIGRDANFYLDLSGANPVVVVGPGGDYIGYDRASETFNFVVNGVVLATINAANGLRSSKILSDGRVSRDSLLYMDLSGGVPIVSFGDGAFIAYNRSLQKFSIVIGGQNVAAIDVNGNLAIRGTLTQNTTP